MSGRPFWFGRICPLMYQLPQPAQLGLPPPRTTDGAKGANVKEKAVPTTKHTIWNWGHYEHITTQQSQPLIKVATKPKQVQISNPMISAEASCLTTRTQVQERSMRSSFKMVANLVWLWSGGCMHSSDRCASCSSREAAKAPGSVLPFGVEVWEQNWRWIVSPKVSLFATLVSVFLAVFDHILFCIYFMFVQIISMVLGDTLFNYRTQVSLGSDLWVRLSFTDSLSYLVQTKLMWLWVMKIRTQY